MFLLRSLAIVASGLVALGGCAKAPPPVADTASDEATIRTMGSEWFKAYAAGDADALAAQYAEDAVVSAPNAPAIRGRAAIHEYYAADIAEMKAEGLVDEQGNSGEVGLSGDLAWEWNTFAIKDASGATVSSGKYTTIFRRRDGKWLIIRDTWNSDSPPAAAASAEATATPTAAPAG